MNRPRITIPCPTANASSPHDAYQTRPMLSLAVAALLGVVSCAIGCGDGAEPPGTPHDLEIASLGDSAATLNRDLRKYFPPVKGRNVLRTHTGARYAAYSWYNAHRLAPKYDHFIRLYQRLFELQKNGKPLPGQLYVFSKKYAARQCVTTYAHLFFGKDKSVTEAGDWYFGPDCQPPVAFGYQGVDGRAAGLSWSAAGGLANPSRVFNLKVMRQLSSGTAYAHHNSRAWNATRVLRHYDSYTLPYGFDRNGRWRAGGGSDVSRRHQVGFRSRNAATRPGRNLLSPEQRASVQRLLLSHARLQLLHVRVLPREGHWHHPGGLCLRRRRSVLWHEEL
jgi:ribosomal protein L34